MFEETDEGVAWRWGSAVRVAVVIVEDGTNFGWWARWASERWHAVVVWCTLHAVVLWWAARSGGRAERWATERRRALLLWLLRRLLLRLLTWVHRLVRRHVLLLMLWSRMERSWSLLLDLRRRRESAMRRWCRAHRFFVTRRAWLPWWQLLLSTHAVAPFVGV